MRNQTPLAPGEPAFDVTVHIVLNDFGELAAPIAKPTKPPPTKRAS